MGTREKAKDAQKIQDLHVLKNALRMYYNDNQNYPENTGFFPDDGCDETSECLGVLMDGEYIPTLSGIEYDYLSHSDNDAFYLWVELDSGRGDEDIKSQEKCGVAEDDRVNNIFMVCGN